MISFSCFVGVAELVENAGGVGFADGSVGRISRGEAELPVEASGEHPEGIPVAPEDLRDQIGLGSRVSLENELGQLPLLHREEFKSRGREFLGSLGNGKLSKNFVAGAITGKPPYCALNPVLQGFRGDESRILDAAQCDPRLSMLFWASSAIC